MIVAAAIVSSASDAGSGVEVDCPQFSPRVLRSSSPTEPSALASPSVYEVLVSRSVAFQFVPRMSRSSRPTAASQLKSASLPRVAQSGGVMTVKSSKWSCRAAL